MKNNNCPNCGAVIEPYSCKCQYCGTWYYDLTLFDTLDDTPKYVKFRMERNGKEVYLTALARPQLKTIEQQPVMYSFYVDGKCNHSIMSEYECDIFVMFECYRDRTTGSLFQIQEGE